MNGRSPSRKPRKSCATRPNQKDSTNPDDKKFIFGLIRARDGGFAQFNADLTAALRLWLLGAARAELVAMTRERGDDDLEANKLRNNVAMLLEDQGELIKTLDNEPLVINVHDRDPKELSLVDDEELETLGYAAIEEPKGCGTGCGTGCAVRPQT